MRPIKKCLSLSSKNYEIWKHCKNAIPLHLFDASYDSTLRFFPQVGPFVADSMPSPTTLSRETSIKQLKAETTKATMRWPMRWCSKYGEKALSIAMALESIPQLKLLSCGETSQGGNQGFDLHGSQPNHDKYTNLIQPHECIAAWSSEAVLR